ncbi:LTA synthase family protein [Streptococcus ovis]|uniref:LTA synthase family protein n=1 Tax=Streptococcus ovis TaxID=82806 RepID=UPI000366F079|nr:LTA synthase family protein [Streptococcus ovis]
MRIPTKKNWFQTFVPYILGVVLIGLLGIYAYSIRQELKTAYNLGHVKIVSHEGSQTIRNISINGYTIADEQIKEHEGWLVHDVDQVDTLYATGSPANNYLLIDGERNTKSLSFEFFSMSEGVGSVEVYIDDTLYQTINTTSKEGGWSFENVNFKQSYSVDKGNLIWYLQLVVFLLAILVFVRNRYYETVSKVNLVKFILISLLSVATLLYARQFLYQDYFTIFQLNFFSTRVILFLPLLTLFIAITLKVFKETIGKKYHLDKVLYYTLTLPVPFVIFFILENTYSQVSNISQSSIQANLLMLYAIFLVIACMTSLRTSGLLLAVVAFGLGVANKIVIDFRNVPILFYNLLQVNDGLNVARNFDFVLTNRIMQSLVVMWIVVIILFFLHKPQSVLPYLKNDKTTQIGPIEFSKRLVTTKAIKFVVGALIGVFLLPNVLLGIAKKEEIKLNLWKMQSTYAHEGFALSFASFYLDSIIDPPKGYSKEKVAEIMEPYKAMEAGTAKKPNIIIIQNESQADFSNIPNMKMDPDPLAFQHSLSENTIKGRLNVSVFGGGTANTEYEVLTSNALGNMSPTIFPYQQIVNSDKNSFARALDAQGYQTVAMHPQSKLNYNRHNVYNNLGFDLSYFDDSDPEINSLIEDPVMERVYLSDKSLFQGIKKLYETKKDEPLFNFVVTMQNHGGYQMDYESTVKVNDSLTNYPQESQYLSLIKKTDDDFKDLVEYFKGQTEPTVLVMYGDHQPRLSEEFYKDFLDDSVKSNKYSVPFVIWANFTLPQHPETTMSPNYLVPYLMNVLQETEHPIPSSPYYQFLNDVRQQVPILTTWGTLGQDGQEIKEPEKIEAFHHYQIMEYYNAFDKHTLNQYFQ